MRRIPTSLLCAGALLLGAVACSDDEPAVSAEESSTTTSTTKPANDGRRLLARGVDVEFVGNDGFAGQTFNVDAWVEDGKVFGEFRVTHIVVKVECANTNGDRTLVLAGTVTVGDPTHLGDPGTRLGVLIRDGEPDVVSLIGDDGASASCDEFLAALPDDLLNNPVELAEVGGGSDIEVGRFIAP